MTNTQWEAMANALALIHGELQAIRKSCERCEARTSAAFNAEAAENATYVLLDQGDAGPVEVKAPRGKRRGKR